MKITQKHVGLVVRAYAVKYPEVVYTIRITNGLFPGRHGRVYFDMRYLEPEGYEYRYNTKDWRVVEAVPA